MIRAGKIGMGTKKSDREVPQPPFSHNLHTDTQASLCSFFSSSLNDDTFSRSSPLTTCEIRSATSTCNAQATYHAVELLQLR